MTDIAVKKPTKKERLALKREQRTNMLNVDCNGEMVTLECPKCHTQQVMTLIEYFEKVNYGSLFSRPLRCELCSPSRPELMFYKVNLKRVAQAGFNWQRERMGISKEVMAKRLEAIDDTTDQICECAEGVADKVNLKAGDVKAAVRNLCGEDTSGPQQKRLSKGKENNEV